MARLTQEQFEKKVYDLVKDEYKVEGTYTGASNKVSIRHNICNTVHEYAPNNFYHGTRCSYCRIKNQTKTHEWFVEKLKESKGTEYEVLSKYKKAKEKVKVKHTVCGYEWESTPDNMLRRKSGCPKCSGNARTNTKEYKKEALRLMGNEYEVLGEYVNARTKVKYKHLTCGTEWETVPYAIKEGSRCPFCKSSRGEKHIIGILKDNDIKYETEKAFDGCSYKSLLRFDIFLPDFNTCIEYDGIQHFEPVDFANKGSKWAQDEFKEIVKKDSIKNDYCSEKGINLIRIPYTSSLEETTEIILTLIRSKAENP